MVGPLHLPGLKNVIAVERGYLALTDSGLFFNMMPDGSLRLGGLTEHWFKGKPNGGRRWKRSRCNTLCRVLPSWV